MSNNVQQTTDVLTERPMWMMFGLLPVKIKPLTLAQIYEIGSELENTEEIELEGNFNPVVKMLQRYTDMTVCSNIVLKMIYRSKIKRVLFGWYIKRHLTMTKYKRVLEFGAISFQATFFLTSFTFLKGTKTVTNPTNTSEATVLGDSWVES